MTTESPTRDFQAKTDPTAVDIAVNHFSVLTIQEVAEFCAKMDTRGVTVQVAVVYERPDTYREDITDPSGREMDD